MDSDDGFDTLSGMDEFDSIVDLLAELEDESQMMSSQCSDADQIIIIVTVEENDENSDGDSFLDLNDSDWSVDNSALSFTCIDGLLIIISFFCFA